MALSLLTHVLLPAFLLLLGVARLVVVRLGNRAGYLRARQGPGRLLIMDEQIMEYHGRLHTLGCHLAAALLLIFPKPEGQALTRLLIDALIVFSASLTLPSHIL